ncbi:MAG: DHHA1 domain-containing protein, partial [bacterium]|nr:DHHA1 domain-containing protein [bacterium]
SKEVVMPEELRRSFKKALQRLRSSGTILLVSPESPDIDSISCVSAFNCFMKWLNPDCQVAMYCCDSLHSLSNNTLFPFIKNTNRITKSLPRWSPEVVVVFDYGSLRRARLPQEYDDIPIIGFDHHPLVDKKPQIVVVDEKDASCTALLFRFFEFAGYSFDRGVAATLLVGLMADTGRLGNASVNHSALITAARLDPDDKITRKILMASRRRIPIGRLPIWQRLINRINLDKTSGLVSLVVSRQDRANWRASKRDIMTFFGILKDIEEGAAAAIITEEDRERWAVSLRTCPLREMNLAKIAKNFGGGGHDYAAGFSWMGSDVNRLVRELQNYIKGIT